CDGEPVPVVRKAMSEAMDAGVGIYRTGEAMKIACDKLGEIKQCFRRGVRLDDGSRAFNTEWMSAIELGFTLDVAEAIAHSALNRRESRGAHQRLDHYPERDDVHFLGHPLAPFGSAGAPPI